MGDMPVNRLRWRLTLLYCGASVASGVVLLLIIVALSRSLPPADVPLIRGVPVVPDQPPGVASPELSRFRSELLILPFLALAIMAVLSLAAGGGVARPLPRPGGAEAGRPP